MVSLDQTVFLKDKCVFFSYIHSPPEFELVIANGLEK